VLQEQARQLSLLSGRRIDVNPLARFQDLDQRLQAGEIDEPTAMELARNRHMQGLQQQHQQRQQAQNDQYTQQTQAIRGGALKVDAMVSELMKDPDYAKVEPELVKQLDTIKTNYPPHMWAAEVKRAYDFEARLLRATAHPVARQRPFRRAAGTENHGGRRPPVAGPRLSLGMADRGFAAARSVLAWLLRGSPPGLGCTPALARACPNTARGLPCP
jgi:hypothetical protein